MRLVQTAATVALALGAVAACVILPGCTSVGSVGSSSFRGGDDFGLLSDDMKEDKAELKGLPSVTEPPPAVPEARGHVSAEQVAQVTGPRKAKVAWAVSLPFSSANIHVVGTDGTVYIAGMGEVGAVRDGKLLWAYQTETSPRVTMADDGRIWFPAPGGGGYFSLNREGQGGRLPYSFQLPPDAAEPRMIGCSGPTGNGRAVRSLIDRDIVMDYGCTRPQARMAVDGMGFVGTAAPDVRAFKPDGTQAWKVATPCAAQTLLTGPGGRAFFSCQDLSLHYVDNGNLAWTKPGDGITDETSWQINSSSIVGLMDRAGTSYFIDHSQDSRTTHVHAIGAAGQPLWTLHTTYFTGSSMQFDAQGRIYLTGMRGMHGWLVCISD